MLAGQIKEALEFGNSELGATGIAGENPLLYFLQGLAMVSHILRDLHQYLFFEHPEVNFADLFRSGLNRIWKFIDRWRLVRSVKVDGLDQFSYPLSFR